VVCCAVHWLWCGRVVFPVIQALTLVLHLCAVAMLSVYCRTHLDEFLLLLTCESQASCLVLLDGATHICLRHVFHVPLWLFRCVVCAPTLQISVLLTAAATPPWPHYYARRDGRCRAMHAYLAFRKMTAFRTNRSSCQHGGLWHRDSHIILSLAARVHANCSGAKQRWFLCYSNPTYNHWL
jgi:hypothetical protein